MDAATHPPSRRAAIGRTTLVILGFAMLAAAGVAEGIRANRWGVSAELTTAAARLDRVPAAFGDWTGTDEPLDRKVQERAEAVGAVSRVYRNARTGATVSVLLLCGPAGPIASHTPDVCYAGLGYTMDGAASRRALAASEFWTARFVKDGGELEVNWAWGAGGDWCAADAPRAEFAAHAALYKLYVVRSLTGAGRDPVPDFLADFLPAVRAALAPG